MLHPLGQGGMGEVWKAVSSGGIEVALKIINGLDKKAGNKELRALQLVKNINHPNLTPIVAFWMKDEKGNILNDGVGPVEPAKERDPKMTFVDLESDEESPHADGRSTADHELIDTDSRADNPAAYLPDPTRSTNSAPLFSVSGNQPVQLIIAMGLGDQNLLDRLEECQAEGLQGIPPDELLDYMMASAKAIDLLNVKHNVQHCDIKPQNILIVGGAAQVCDFGLAKSTHDHRVTANNTYTVAYGAPEILNTARPSSATDQYSLALTYYELRAGDLPFADQSLSGILLARAEDGYDFSKIPAAEQEVVARAASREPTDRFPNCVAMVNALRQAHYGLDPERTSSLEPQPMHSGDPATVYDQNVSDLRQEIDQHSGEEEIEMESGAFGSDADFDSGDSSFQSEETVPPDTAFRQADKAALAVAGNKPRRLAAPKILAMLFVLLLIGGGAGYAYFQGLIPGLPPPPQVSTDPPDPETVGAMESATAKWNQGEHEAALRELQAAITQEDPPPALVALRDEWLESLLKETNQLLATDLPAQAEPLAALVREFSPDDSRLHVTALVAQARAILHLDVGRADEVKSLLDEANGKQPATQLSETPSHLVRYHAMQLATAAPYDADKAIALLPTLHAIHSPHADSGKPLLHHADPWETASINTSSVALFAALATAPSITPEQIQLAAAVWPEKIVAMLLARGRTSSEGGNFSAAREAFTAARSYAESVERKQTTSVALADAWLNDEKASVEKAIPDVQAAVSLADEAALKALLAKFVARVAKEPAVAIQAAEAIDAAEASAPAGSQPLLAAAQGDLLLGPTLAQLNNPGEDLAEELASLQKRCQRLAAADVRHAAIDACLAECILAEPTNLTESELRDAEAALDRIPAPAPAEFAPYVDYVRALRAAADAQPSRAGEDLKKAYSEPRTTGPLSSSARQSQAARLLVAAAASLVNAQPDQLAEPVYSPSKAKIASELLSAIIAAKLPLSPEANQQAQVLGALANHYRSPPDLDAALLAADALQQTTNSPPIQVLSISASGHAKRDTKEDRALAITAYATLGATLQQQDIATADLYRTVVDPAVAVANRYVKEVEEDPGRMIPPELQSSLASVYSNLGALILSEPAAAADAAPTAEEFAQSSFLRAEGFKRQVEYVAGQALALVERYDIPPDQKITSLTELAEQASALDEKAALAQLIQAWADMLGAREESVRSTQIEQITSAIQTWEAVEKSEPPLPPAFHSTGLRLAAEAIRLLAFLEPKRREEHLQHAEKLAQQAIDRSPPPRQFSASMTHGYVWELSAKLRTGDDRSSAFATSLASYNAALAMSEKEPTEKRDPAKWAAAINALNHCRLQQLASDQIAADQVEAHLSTIIEQLRGSVSKSPLLLASETRSLLCQAIRYQALFESDAEETERLYTLAESEIQNAAESAHRANSPRWTKYQLEWAALLLARKRKSLAGDLAQEIIAAKRKGDSINNDDLVSAIEIASFSAEKPAEAAAAISDNFDLFPPTGPRNKAYLVGLRLLHGETCIKSSDSELLSSAMEDVAFVVQQTEEMMEYLEARDDLRFRALAIKANVAAVRYTVAKPEEARDLANAASEAHIAAIAAHAHADPHQQRSLQLRFQLALLHRQMIKQLNPDEADKQDLIKKAMAALEPLKEDSIGSEKVRMQLASIRKQLSEIK